MLDRYHADFAPGGSEDEKLYALFLHSRLFALLRKVAHQPITVALAMSGSVRNMPYDKMKQVIAFITVCARAERDGRKSDQTPLSLFVRALEGAYITLASPKRLFYIGSTRLQTKTTKPMLRYSRPLSAQIVDEWLLSAEKKAALCAHQRGRGWTTTSDFYYLKDGAEDVLIDEEDCADDATNDFVICSVLRGYLYGSRHKI
ncbi:MAG: hypothetical protein ACLU9R_07480 [Faecalibacterium sp.]